MFDKVLPPESFSTSARTSGSMRFSSRISLPANEESNSGSRAPIAMCSISFSSGTLGFCSSGRESVLSRSQTPTASTMTKCVFVFASGVTDWKSVSEMTRTPRPFICSKKLRDFTERMNITISSGLMSVPVAIMSTVTAMRGHRTIAESLNQFFWRSAGGAVGDLLAEVVSFIELFAHDLYDVVGV